MELTNKKRDALLERLKNYTGELDYSNNETIKFYLNSELVGEAALPRRTFGEQRIIIAALAEVDKFNDFEIVAEDGTVRLRGSETSIGGMFDDELDGTINYGAKHGYDYHIWRNSEICECCGNLVRKGFSGEPEKIAELRKEYFGQ